MNIAKYLPLLAVLALAGCDISSNEPPPDPGIAKAESAVKRLLIDPDSARFEDTSFVPGTGAYCGGVNAKNRYGGYTGDRSFAVKDGVVILLRTREEVDLMQREVEAVMNAARSARSMDDLEKAQKAIDRFREEHKRASEDLKRFLQWCGD